jgi:hypothetical protein
MIDIIEGLTFVVVMVGYFWLVTLGIMGLVRILRRMGYSGYWVLVLFVPLIPAYAVWRLSKAKWPAIPSA